MSEEKKKVVFVGMSGGVDSSLSAYLLKQQGYEVIGVFIKVWHPDFLECHWEKERLDAMRVAAHLSIPFLTCNAEQTYKNDVADYFIREYREGRTPNPDVMCNTHIKFGAFYEYAKAHGADYIATGHYAQVIHDADGPRLLRGEDKEKDQSYFLWNISKEALAHTLFPVGHLKKEEVRVRAGKAGIPTAEKNDSQGVCFLGHIDMHEFLSHYISLKEGAVLNEEGVVIGTHKGAEIYTYGQRHGFTIHPQHGATQPYYVIAKSIADNTITVSPHTKSASQGNTRLILSQVRWFGEVAPGTTVSLQTRYRQKPFPATLVSDSATALFEVAEFPELPAVGQSCVIYDGMEVRGGGIIESEPNT